MCVNAPNGKTIIINTKSFAYDSYYLGGLLAIEFLAVCTHRDKSVCCFNNSLKKVLIKIQFLDNVLSFSLPLSLEFHINEKL